MSTPSTAIQKPWPGLIAAYRDRLPVGDDWNPVTLLEGGTPLIEGTHISERTGCTVHLKVEGLNPTGSFKDRGMTMAVTDALGPGPAAGVCGGERGNAPCAVRRPGHPPRAGGALPGPRGHPPRCVDPQGQDGDGQPRRAARGPAR